MTDYTINIGPEAADPNPRSVKPGDTVTFVLVDRTDEVTIHFKNDDSPLTVQQVTINGATETSSSPKTVKSTVSTGTYTYFAKPITLPHADTDPEPPGTVKGDLDVNTDPRPPDPTPLRK